MKVLYTSLFSACLVAASNTGTAEASTTCAKKTFDVKSYGAMGNALANDTGRVQAAINAAQSAGCGTVLGHAQEIPIWFIWQARSILAMPNTVRSSTA
jgi:hypothetical protein